MTHQPDTPFGCAATWGPLVAPHARGLMADMRLHTCNFHRSDHTGPCQCKCGALPGVVA
jgi:hypothetical protein